MIKNYCASCKTVEELMPKPYNRTGSRMCRSCNTKRARKYRATKTGMTKVRKAVYKSISKFPEKQNARSKLLYRISTGEVVRPKICLSCESPGKVQAHHDDYSKPLEVRWLCTRCHAKMHPKS